MTMPTLMPRRALLLLLAALCLAGAGETPALAVTSNSAVQANVVKPLTLKSLQNFDMGIITLKPGLWSGATVSLSQANLLTCDPTYLTCSGATLTARYNVQGSNHMTVNITAPDVRLVNTTDSTQVLTMVVDNPGQVVLTSSGVPGVNFDLGGSITLNSTASSGDYTGTFAVTVDYQ
jgi:hypothetical protein